MVAKFMANRSRKNRTEIDIPRDIHGRIRVIIAECAAEAEISIEDVTSRLNSLSAGAARRAIVQGIVAEFPWLTLAQLGSYINRHHTTVAYHLFGKESRGLTARQAPPPPAPKSLMPKEARPPRVRRMPVPMASVLDAIRAAPRPKNEVNGAIAMGLLARGLAAVEQVSGVPYLKAIDHASHPAS